MSTFSHSRIDTFETCPKKYEFAYLLKLPRAATGIEAFMGSRVHEALEWLYMEVRACRLPSADDVVDRYQALWDETWDDAVRVVRAERTPSDYRAIGEKALRDYHRRHQPFDQGTTVGLEMRVTLALDDDHDLIGYIDRLVKVEDGVWEIHDYKTSGSLPTQQHMDADRQLALYELAVREMYPDARDVTLVWHYLAFDHEVRSKRTTQQLETLRGDLLDTVRMIEAQTAFSARTSRICDWCDYRAVCPAWRHLYETQRLPSEEREHESGVALVDQYLEVSSEIAWLKSRQEELRDAIAVFAADQELERVFGTDSSVKVYRYPNIALPDAQDPRRAQLEAELRGLGLWERFSALSAYQLSRALQDGSLDPSAIERIEPYVTRGEGVKLYPGKRF